jgi:hypothetical protein
MSETAEGSAATEDETANSIAEPLKVAPPQTEPGVALLEQLGSKWIGAFVIIAVALSAGIAFWLSYYVIQHDEAAEALDYNQLTTIVGPLQSIATLMIGTIFGVVVQSGNTAINRGKADRNKDEAERQHGQATENEKRATVNAKLAAKQADTANELRTALRLMQEHYDAGPDVGDKTVIPTVSLTAERTSMPLDAYVHHVLKKADANIPDESQYRRYLSG